MHKTELRIQWFDTDREDIAYFGNYFRFFSTAEDEFFRSIGISHNGLKEQYNIAFIRIEAQCRYKRPAVYGDLIEINTWAKLENRIFLTFKFRVSRKKDHILLAEGKVRTACVTLTNGFSLTRIPDKIFDRLKEISDRHAQQKWG